MDSKVANPPVQKVLDNKSGKATPTGKDSKHPCGCRQGRNLVVCIDGTSNKYGTKSSNVVEFYSLVLKNKDADQMTWYNSGIGTYAQPSVKTFAYYKQQLWHAIDMAIAWNFEHIVHGAYQWLSDNYQEDDCIFLLGFSRGAYQVGLIHKGNEMQIPFAYELYSRERADKDLSKNFKKTFCREVKVHFVGAWDTVSSIGIVRPREMLPGTTDGMKHVCYFRHALALDERRVKFLPEYAYGGQSIRPDNLDPQNPAEGQLGGKERRRKFKSDIKEVWFAGTHSDIGGGNVENKTLSRSRPPLRWMVSEAKIAGLRMADFHNEFLAIEALDILESLTAPWQLLEYWPIKCLTYKDSTSTKRKLHRGQGRVLCAGQKIHITVILTKEDYVPRAHETHGLDIDLKSLKPDIEECVRHWNANTNNLLRHLEGSEYERSRILIRQAFLKAQNENGRHESTELQNMAESPSEKARNALFDALIDILIAPNSKELGDKFLNTVVLNIKTADIRRQPCALVRDSALIREQLEKERASTEPYPVAKTFMRRFISPIMDTGDSSRVYCLTVSKDGEFLYSGDDQGWFRVWDVVTGEQRAKLETEMDFINSIALLPDGKHCVLAGGYSDEKNLQIWEAKVDGRRIKSYTGHFDIVNAVCIVPESNGKLIATASNNRIIRICDTDTGETIREIDSRADWIKALAFSESGQMVAGASDGTIQIWDLQVKLDGRESVQELGVLNGHTDQITAIAFSHDGQWIVSSSLDRTLGIWNAKSRCEQPPHALSLLRLIMYRYGDYAAMETERSPAGRMAESEYGRFKNLDTPQITHRNVLVVWPHGSPIYNKV
ncbi:hypothetical protein GYMLUDRAFT_248006 [Collybiopsis luxurians FD-317 M1]|uniref:T6SS Phospholipase effector Tle1-like catalytic domain-containing protein n=1 Tax=Collybiopsis luxurians FD-317 M1 TaxID=944289 RepID=A0A0D0CM42_9AGAR|nr:hypothetical protein GYMLUDRAFT_248006 [Collybiopsis luxurians FD-317 M1]